MKRTILLFFVTLASLALTGLSVEFQSRQKVLLISYYRYLMVGDLDGYCNDLSATATDEQKKEIGASLSRKKESVFLRLKKELTSAIGETAQADFSSFVSTYTAAAKDGNAQYRNEIASVMAVSPAPGNYMDLRNEVMGRAMAKDVEEMSKFLSDIEMWINLKKKVKTAMPLEIWLHREDVVEQAIVQESVPGDSKAGSLRDTETSLPEFKADDAEEANPIDAFNDMRAAKRQRAMDEAKSGMQQIAQERETAEREDASRKLEAANADAAALTAQANKIAAVEKDAIEQSKNTWGSRIKNILGATVSAAGGAFFGGIGARAGEEAVNAVFSDHHK